MPIWNWAKTYMYHDSTRTSVLWFFFVVPEDQRHHKTTKWLRRTVKSIRHGTILRGQSLGQQNWQFTIPGRGRPIVDQPEASRVDHGPTDHTPRRATTRLRARITFQSRNIKWSASLRATPTPITPDPSYSSACVLRTVGALGTPAADRPFWMEAAAASRDFFPRTTDPVTAPGPGLREFRRHPARPLLESGRG